MTNWKRSFKVRTTLEDKLKKLSAAIHSKEQTAILEAFENLINSASELKQLYMEQQTIICPHCKQDTGITIDNKELTCPSCQQKIHYCPVSEFYCQVFKDHFKATDKERLDQCKNCIERTDTISCSHLDLLN